MEKKTFNDVMANLPTTENDMKRVMVEMEDGRKGWISAEGLAQVAAELKAHYEKLFYYDNKQKGEVDFLVDDSSSMSVLPIEVKSGKDYTVHSALDNLMAIQDYHIVSSIVLSNEREIKTKGNILYLPIYYVMFLENKVPEEENLYF